MTNKKVLLIIILFFYSKMGITQNNTFDKVIDSSKVLFNHNKYDEAINLLENSLKNGNSVSSEIFIQLYLNAYKLDRNNSINYLYKSKANYEDYLAHQKAQLDYYLGNIHRILNKHNDSTIYYSLKSLSIYNQYNDKHHLEKYKIYNNLYIAYNRIENLEISILYLKKALQEIIKTNEKKYLVYTYNNLGTYHSSNKNDRKNLDSSKYYYKKALNVNYKSSINGSIYQNLGSLFLDNNIDSAEYYFDIALKDNISNKGLSSLYFNKAIISKQKNKIQNSINYYIKANQIAAKSNNLKMQSYIAEDLSNLYYENNNYKKSVEQRVIYEKFSDSLKKIDLLKNIDELETKYETEKKEKENIQLQTSVEKEQNQKRNLLYGSLTLLLFGGVTTLLFLKNSKRKRLLAEKNNEIEQQKVVTLLKEQELTSIDAMIEGQEKERKKIAEDLHDDLGSVLTTLKLHFENYKVNKDKKKFKEDELIDKTDALLDEAYKKVRGIAHAKNSGVIANQGLLLAIENMAEKVSSSKKIEIDVINHGLENRLENSLELTIFRIIQELITNIIKHAQASQATIHIINHEKSLNLMVEDNGKGFDTSKISNKGMGIHSIDKRIEHLDGTMTIESELNKGTTVIIDIPI